MLLSNGMLFNVCFDFFLAINWPCWNVHPRAHFIQLCATVRLQCDVRLLRHRRPKSLHDRPLRNIPRIIALLVLSQWHVQLRRNCLFPLGIPRLCNRQGETKRKNRNRKDQNERHVHQRSRQGSSANVTFVYFIACYSSIRYIDVSLRELILFCSIYVCHDEVKDKDFELELSWVGQGE